MKSFPKFALKFAWLATLAALFVSVRRKRAEPRAV